jgi:lycopene cyclase domain-containing protein
VDLRQELKAGAQGRRPSLQRLARQLGGQFLGAVEAEDEAAARLGIEKVGEAGLDAGALVEEGQGIDGTRQVVRHTGGVLARLGLDTGEGGLGLLGFHDASRLAIDVEEVIRVAMACLKREFADGHAPTGMEVDLPGVLNQPARGPEGGVDGFAGFGFGGLHHNNLSLVRCDFSSLAFGLSPKSPQGRFTLLTKGEVVAEQTFAYSFIEAAMFMGIWIVGYSTGALKTLTTRRFMTLTVSLYSLWIVLDLCAVALGIFRFPPEGNLPLRIVGLPIEEHLFFPLHTMVIWMLLLLSIGSKRI